QTATDSAFRATSRTRCRCSSSRGAPSTRSRSARHRGGYEERRRPLIVSAARAREVSVMVGPLRAGWWREPGRRPRRRARRPPAGRSSPGRTRNEGSRRGRSWRRSPRPGSRAERARRSPRGPEDLGAHDHVRFGEIYERGVQRGDHRGVLRVALPDVAHARGRRHGQAGRGGGEVGDPQRGAQSLVLRLREGDQDAPRRGLVTSGRVPGDLRGERFELGADQRRRAVERVEPGHGSGIADVVQDPERPSDVALLPRALREQGVDLAADRDAVEQAVLEVSLAGELGMQKVDGAQGETHAAHLASSSEAARRSSRVPSLTISRSTRCSEMPDSEAWPSVGAGRLGRTTRTTFPPAARTASASLSKRQSVITTGTPRACAFATFSIPVSTQIDAPSTSRPTSVPSTCWSRRISRWCGLPSSSLSWSQSPPTSRRRPVRRTGRYESAGVTKGSRMFTAFATLSAETFPSDVRRGIAPRRPERSWPNSMMSVTDPERRVPLRSGSMSARISLIGSPNATRSKPSSRRNPATVSLPDRLRPVSPIRMALMGQVLLRAQGRKYAVVGWPAMDTSLQFRQSK